MKRRTFLADSGTAVGASWVALSVPALLATAETALAARTEGAGFQVLTPVEAAEFEAIAAQIVPSDDTPGAREAGVIHFLDAALAGVASGDVRPLREGLAELQGRVRERFGADAFAGLPDPVQIELLTDIEGSRFFARMRYFTLAGMFCMPSQGGNRDQLGWKLIGFEGPYPTQPPFGHYDADYMEKGA